MIDDVSDTREILSITFIGISLEDSINTDIHIYIVFHSTCLCHD